MSDFWLWFFYFMVLMLIVSTGWVAESEINELKKEIQKLKEMLEK